MDVILEVANSGVALAVAGVAKDKNKVYINSGAATSDLTGAQCNANTIHWVYDTYMLAKSTGGALVKAGGDSWFFITADYAFGHALQRDTTEFITAAGGKVLGSVDVSVPGHHRFLLAAAAGAGVGREGARPGQCRHRHDQHDQAGAGVRPEDDAGRAAAVHQRRAFAGAARWRRASTLTDSFYWDMNDRTRAFSERLKPKAPDRRPTMVQAGVYSSVLHYLKVAPAMGIAAGQEGRRGDGRAA